MSNTVRAKFRCNSITDYGTRKEVKASAVYGNEGENADFTKYTPSGELSMHISEETKAAEFFKPGEEFYLTFEKA